MSKTAKKADPALWDRVKEAVTQGDKGGRPGQWSARKAQLATAEYKKAGGGYEGRKSPDNHLQEWTDEHWGTKSGEPSEETGERYLPAQARDALTDEEYRRTTAKKREDTRRGRQFSAQPGDVARKAASVRDAGARAALATLSRTDLMARAKARGIAGLSRMRKDELVEALAERCRPKKVAPAG